VHLWNARERWVMVNGHVKWGKESTRGWVEGKWQVITLQSAQFFGMSQ